MAGLRSLGGGEIHEYTSLLEDTRRQALDRLVANATLLGANAVLSMRFDSSELSGTMSEIVAYGTAVIVAPDASATATPGRHRRMTGGLGVARIVVLAVRADAVRRPGWPRSRSAAAPAFIGGFWLRAHRAGAHRRRRSSSASAIARTAADRDRRPDRPGRRRAAGHAPRAAVPAQRRGLRRPDVGPADARLARSGERRAAVRAGGLSASGVLSSPAGASHVERPRS